MCLVNVLLLVPLTVQCVWSMQLRYTFPKYMLLQEPLLIIAAFYLLFVMVIIYVRLDFAISKVLVVGAHSR